MIYYLNGRFVPEEEATISVHDRGFLYGDGLFETLRGQNGGLPLWPLHWERLFSGAGFLGIQIPLSQENLLNACVQLLAENNLTEAALRITLSRGVGARGYSPKGADNPTLVITIHPLPAPRNWFSVVVSRFALPSDDPISAFKNCNKIRQILARAEADAAGANEAILLNDKGCVVEGSSTNLFWFEGSKLCTPPLAAGILPGVTRAVLLESAASLGMGTEIKNITLQDLLKANGSFLTAATFGCVPIASIDGSVLKQNPAVQILQEKYLERLLIGNL